MLVIVVLLHPEFLTPILRILGGGAVAFYHSGSTADSTSAIVDFSKSQRFLLRKSNSVTFQPQSRTNPTSEDLFNVDDLPTPPQTPPIDLPQLSNS